MAAGIIIIMKVKNKQNCTQNSNDMAQEDEGSEEIVYFEFVA
jgi:hypothetical protein